MSTPPLYDIELGLAELAKARLRRDPVTRQQSAIGDTLAFHLDRHFAAEELETAGRALLIAAGGTGALAVEDMPPQVIVNIIAFAGARLILDGRGYTGPPDAFRSPR